MLRNDESILVHIRGQDCVAIEARYHKRCYKAYTRCLSLKPKIVGQTLYDKAFDQFCLQIVKNRILQGQEILLLSYLLKEFISCVKTIENVDVPYTAERLKKRIQDRYPQLVFHASKKMNKGTLVYADNISVGDVADEMPTITNDSELESDSEDENNQRNIDDKKVSPKDMYFTALEINKLLKNSTGIDADWPPDSHDLTVTKANQSIPVLLYNFLSWCVG